MLVRRAYTSSLLHRLAETPPETPQLNNEATAAVAPPALTAAPPLPARPVAAVSTPEVAGETNTSTPSPVLEREEEAEVAGEADSSSPPKPENAEEVAVSPDPPVDTAATEVPEASDEATGSSPPPALEAENEEEAEGALPPAPELEPEKLEDVAGEEVAER